jgi:cytochrome b
VSHIDERATLLVWDLPVRLAHWSLAACVAGAWATHYAGIEWFDWHRRCGYAVLVIALFRVAWGFVGTRHARFASFLRGPRRIIAYVRGGAAEQVAGHNPLGALSVVAMLAVLSVQGLTGLFANDEIANSGPLLGWISQETSNRLTSLHRANSTVLLSLVALHVAAVLYYGIVRQQPLVRAMITGRREAGALPGESIQGSRTLLAAAIAAALAAALALVIRAAPEAAISLF